MVEPLASNLKRLRRQGNLTQAALAERAGLPRASLAAMEQADTNPGVESVVAVAGALGVEPGELLSADPGHRWFRVSPAEHRIYRGDNTRFVSHLVSPISSKGVEIQSVHMDPGCNSVGRPHPSGAQEFFHCLKGTATIVIDGEPVSIPAGHLVQFPGHYHHIYRNLSETEPVEAVSVVALAMR